MKDTKKNFFKTALAIGFVGFSLAYLLVPQFHREDWKSLANSLDRKSSIYMVMSSSDPVTYYRKDLKLKDMREMEKELNDKSITVIPYTADIHGIDYRKILSGKGYTLQETKSFRDLTYEVWVK
jgi:predicted transcriptional regulator